MRMPCDLDIEYLINLVVDLKSFESNCENTEENREVIRNKERDILSYLKGVI